LRTVIRLVCRLRAGSRHRSAGVILSLTHISREKLALVHPGQVETLAQRPSTGWSGIDADAAEHLARCSMPRRDCPAWAAAIRPLAAGA